MKQIMIRISWLLVVLVITLPPLDPYLDASMTRLMLLQSPILVLLGFLASQWLGLKLPMKGQLKHPMGQNWALAGLFIGLGMVTFWMVPRSVDLAVAHDGIDALMHLTLLIAGWILAVSLKNLPLLLQMAVGIYVTSMGGTFGIILSQAAARICARFTVEQQQAAGFAILWASGIFLILHIGWSLWMLIKSGPSEVRPS